jgi:hypothetical protein
MDDRRDNATVVAQIIMETDHDNPSLRQSFRHDWAKLYKAGDYYLDLSIQAQASSAELRGQLWPIAGEGTFPQGKVSLLHDSYVDLPEGQMNDLGSFHLKVQQAGRYQLFFELDQGSIMVPAIDIS